MKRGITELVTPGVAMSDTVLSHRENNFLAALHFGKSAIGVAFLDISTGEFLTAEGTADYVDKIMGNMAPKEVLVERTRRQQAVEMLSEKYTIFELDDWLFTSEAAEERLRAQFGTASLKGFGIQGMRDAIVAAGAIMHYLDYTKHTRTAHITSISRIEEDRYVRLDKFTVRNLELVQPLDEGGRSLLGVLDRTVTPMGSRLLHRWLMFPLRDPRAINERLDVVEAFFRMPDERDVLEEQLHQVGDLERLVSKVATRRATPRDLLQIRAALVALEPIRAVCAEAREGALRKLGERLDPCGAVSDAIGRTIRPDAGLKGEFIAEGVSAELDELRAIAYSGKDYLLQIQAREVRNTGITSLKIGFNNVFGYYIEVTNTHRDKVPTEWIRKQTLVNAERYITQELKEYEEKILTAQDKIASLQESIYNDLITTISAHIPTLQQNAATLAKIDVLSAFTRGAIENRYTRPVVDDSLLLRLTEARHPVIERQLPPGEPYISNTVELDNEHRRNQSFWAAPDTSPHEGRDQPARQCPRF